MFLGNDGLFSSRIFSHININEQERNVRVIATPEALRTGLGLAKGLAGELDQRQMAGALDGARHFALVASAGARLAAWSDFAILGNITPQ